MGLSTVPCVGHTVVLSLAGRRKYPGDQPFLVGTEKLSLTQRQARRVSARPKSQEDLVISGKGNSCRDRGGGSEMFKGIEVFGLFSISCSHHLFSISCSHHSFSHGKVLSEKVHISGTPGWLGQISI